MECLLTLDPRGNLLDFCRALRRFRLAAPSGATRVSGREFPHDTDALGSAGQGVLSLGFLGFLIFSALANDRLEERSDGALALRLKTRWPDGTTPILMERREHIERWVPLISSAARASASVPRNPGARHKPAGSRRAG